MSERDAAAQKTVPLLFTEKRLNTTLLGIAFAFSSAGGVTLLVHAFQSGRLWPVLPVALGLLAWGLMVGNNLARRRRLSPVLRLEAERLRYIGGPAWKPRLVDIAYEDIQAVEKQSASVLVINVRRSTQKHRLPVGLLSRPDRTRFLEAFYARQPVHDLQGH